MDAHFASEFLGGGLHDGAVVHELREGWIEMAASNIEGHGVCFFLYPPLATVTCSLRIRAESI